ncbi:MAG TPA: hypothetical protein DEG47_27750 [Cyanobacteria bacterium UBA11148]|nr:hypothetical protein [Cyanobacteria bacterium UBA11148]
MNKPDVTVTVEPMEGGSVVYLPVAPPTAKDEPGSQVALKLLLDNQKGSSDVHLIKIKIVFGIAPDVDFVAPVIYDKDSVAQKDLFPFLIEKEKKRTFSFSRSSKDNIKLPSPPPPGFTLELFFEGFDTPVTVSNLKLAPHANPTPEGSYRFPAKASDLKPGQYWSGAASGTESHHSGDERFAHDMGVIAWDSDKNKWSGNPGKSGAQNTDYLCWNEPVYAMADGVVEAIENGKPDIPPKTPQDQQNKGANFVKIRHGDEVMSYLHLREGSVNPNLSKGVHVKAGQFLGRVGNSGNTDHPHLHISAVKNGHLRPILFHDIHVFPREHLLADGSPNAPWVAVDGQGLPWRGKEGNAIWPAPVPPKQVTRLGDSGTQAGAIRIIAAASVGPDQVVTAVRTQNGNLKLIVWDISSDGKTVTRLGDSGNQAGVSDIIAVASLSLGRVITAVRTAAGNLKLICWGIFDGGKTVTRLGDSGNQAGITDFISVTSVGSSQVVTAVRTNEKTLKLIVWDVSNNGKTIARLGDTTNQPISIKNTIVTSVGLGRVATTIRTEDGKLKVIVWDISPDGKTVIRLGDSGDQAGATEIIAVAALGFDRVATAVRTEAGNLKVIVWGISPNGETVTRLGDSSSQAGATDMIAIASLGSDQVATAVRTKEGNLKIIVWGVFDDGESIARLGDSGSQAGAIDAIALMSLAKGQVATAVRTQGNLKLIAWEIN